MESFVEVGWRASGAPTARLYISAASHQRGFTSELPTLTPIKKLPFIEGELRF